jgi:hypothetical protein
MAVPVMLGICYPSVTFISQYEVIYNIWRIKTRSVGFQKNGSLPTF